MDICFDCIHQGLSEHHKVSSSPVTKVKFIGFFGNHEPHASFLSGNFFFIFFYYYFSSSRTTVVGPLVGLLCLLKSDL